MAKKPKSKASETLKDDDTSTPDIELESEVDAGSEKADTEFSDDALDSSQELPADATDQLASDDEIAPTKNVSHEEELASQDQIDDPLEAEANPKLEKQPPPIPDADGGPSALPLVLGGIAAGAVGFAAAYFGLAQQPDTRGAALTKQVQEVTQALESQTTGMTELTTKVESLASNQDVEPLATQLQGLTEAIANLSERIVTSEAALEKLDERLSQVEQRPVREGASEAAIAAYENELEAARNAIAQQRSEIESLIQNALSAENSAESAAQSAMRRAATSRILTAIENGNSYASALADLEATGIDTPDELSSNAESGVASLLDLQEAFPDAARAALSASRSVEGAGTGFSGFLRNQLGARSLEPREGNDADAVLSRAEAALKEGRLTDALAEIETLPEEGRAELTEWSGKVAKRKAALSAAQSLSETLN